MEQLDIFEQGFTPKELDFLGYLDKYKEQYAQEEIKVREVLKEWKKEMKPIRLAWLNPTIEELEKEVRDAYLNDAQLRKERKPYWMRMAILEGLRDAFNKEILLKRYIHERIMITNPITEAPNKIDVKRVKENLDINLVITLNKAGFTMCPFHTDKTPSLKWYPETKQLHCFSCGWHGDVIAFIMKRDNLNFKEVINKLK
jgi:hypothetical protein